MFGDCIFLPVRRQFLQVLVASVVAVCGCTSYADPAPPKSESKSASTATQKTPKSLPTAVQRLSRPTAPPRVQAASQSHQQGDAFKIQGDGVAGSLLTLCLDSDDNIVALIGAARYSLPGKSENVGQVQVFDPSGKKLRTWKIDFKAQAVGSATNGDLLAAGDGKIARFDREGKLLSAANLSFVDEILKDKKSLQEQAKQRREAQLKSYDQQLTNFKRQKEQFATRPKNGSTAPDRATSSIDLMIKNYEQAKKSIESQTIENLVDQIVGRLKTINSVCTDGKDLFVVCGEVKGYGYSVWRMDQEFKNPKMVLSSLGGCCGQMDVQCAGGKLVVAENTRHRVAIYDRDGKLLSSFGQRSRTPAGEGFGGCCNPMNTRPSANGDVYTAESEGIIKRFNAKGEFQGVVGTVQLTGGCKNVAVATSKDGKRVYFCDVPGSRVVALTAKSDESTQRP
jgi:hypothetical protein